MPDLLYRSEPAAHRRRITLDTLDLIYHRTSGTTHIVAEPVPQILEALDQGPADAAEIVRRLAAAHDMGLEGAEPIIAARLKELEVAGLVTRA